MKGLREFILRGNLVDLAVAVVIGAAFGAVIAALVKDLITPLIGAIGGKPDFSALSFSVNKSQFLYGDFINALLAFLIIAAVVYFFVVKPVAALMDRYMPKKEVGPQRQCPECLRTSPSPPAAARSARPRSAPRPRPGVGVAVSPARPGAAAPGRRRRSRRSARPPRRAWRTARGASRAGCRRAARSPR